MAKQNVYTFQNDTEVDVNVSLEFCRLTSPFSCYAIGPKSGSNSGGKIR